jgi:hypothetical protein
MPLIHPDKPQPTDVVFQCPHCRVQALQRAGMVWLKSDQMGTIETDIMGTKCDYCKAIALFVDGKIVHPRTVMFPLPNDDMPDDAKRDFYEARLVATDSPRAAAALLRLSIERICLHLGETGTINEMIRTLVQKGLNSKVQKMLDYARVAGNSSVHPGQMDEVDTIDHASVLFELTNQIVSQLITEPRELDTLYQRLPAEKRTAIEIRDAAKSPD